MYEGDAEAEVISKLAEVSGVEAEDILLTNSGMNAFYTAFLAVREIQRPLGRKIWIQLGWLYLDTGEILQKFLGSEERFIKHLNVFDLEGLEQLFVQNPDQIAAVITEAPNNPLLQTPDLQRIYELCNANGALHISDPTSATNQCQPAPLRRHPCQQPNQICGQRRRPAGGCSDLQSRFKFHQDLREVATLHHEPPMSVTCKGLPTKLRYPSILERINQNPLALAELLENHSAVRKLHWAYSPESKANYHKLARRPNAPGGLLSFELNKPIASFYDHVPVLKSPSFGTRFTMICPFMYLAHYDLVTTPEGRNHLADNQIDPELIRSP